MKVSIKKSSDMKIPQDIAENLPMPSSNHLLASPGENARFRKPRDSFAVMKRRNLKHTVGLTIPQK